MKWTSIKIWAQHISCQHVKNQSHKTRDTKKTFVPTSFKFFSTSQNPTKEIKLGSWRTLSTAAPVPVWPLGNFFLRRRRTCRRWAATSTSTRQRSRRDSIETFSGIVKMQPEAGFFRARNELGQTLLPNLFLMRVEGRAGTGLGSSPKARAWWKAFSKKAQYLILPTPKPC